jgi:hypothetical protein
MGEKTKLKHVRKKMTVVGKETTENNQNVNHLLTINWKLIFLTCFSFVFSPIVANITCMTCSCQQET